MTLFEVLSVGRNDFHAISGPDPALSEDSRVHPAPPWVKLLGDSNEMSIEKRRPNGLAWLGERRDFQQHRVPDSYLRPRHDEIPVDTADGDVLSCCTDVDGVAFCSQRLYPLKRKQTDGSFRPAMESEIPLSVTFNPV